MVSLLVSVLIAVLIAGVALWVVRALAPHLGLPAIAITIVQVVIVLVLVIWLLQILAGGHLGTTLRFAD
jgi:hypothetical protein